MARLYQRTLCFRTAVLDLALEFRWVVPCTIRYIAPHGPGTSANRYTSPTGLSLSDWGRPLFANRPAEMLAMALLDAAERQPLGCDRTQGLPMASLQGL